MTTTILKNSVVSRCNLVDRGRTSKTASRTPHGSQRSIHSAQKHGLSDIDKLFAERIVYIPKIVELNKKSTLNTVSKILIKTLLESIRQKRLSNSDYQQLQVDTAFLKLSFWPFVMDTNLMSSLLDEVLISAQIQIKDVNPLDYNVLLINIDH